MKYKVCILAAGKGSRVSYSKIINKALLPVGDVSALSRIINKFPEEVEIVIPVGYNAEQIKDFLEISHPNSKITCVDVDNWDQPGSGPGYSLLCCKKHLDCPFIFTSCDTIVLEPIPAPDKNWIGVATVSDSKDFCMAEVANGFVVKFYDKVNTSTLMKICEDFRSILDHAFVGMAGVHDHKDFFNALEGNSSQLIRNELQVSNGLNKLIEKGLFTQKFTWFDTGSEVSYEYTNRYFNNNIVLLKDNEFIYFEDGKVIKYFADEKVVANRVERAKILEGIVPSITSHKDNFYTYDYVEGRTLAQTSDKKIFKDILEHYHEKLWKPIKLDAKKEKEFQDVCFSFYKEKTEQRVGDYFEKTGGEDRQEVINGIDVPPVKMLLDRIDWTELSQGVPVLFHGDFQPENIVITNLRQFVLLDWRQDFGGLTEYGDLYYDFAKLYHAFIVIPEIIRKNEFEITTADNQITYNFLIKRNLLDFKEIFEQFVKRWGYDLGRVKVLMALIYLNIAPLHHDPYNKLLFYLGKSVLNDLNEVNDEQERSQKSG